MRSGSIITTLNNNKTPQKEFPVTKFGDKNRV